jgi:hypothetical protein
VRVTVVFHIIKNTLKSTGARFFGEYWVLQDERELHFNPTYRMQDFTDFTAIKPNYHGSLPPVLTKT